MRSSQATYQFSRWDISYDDTVIDKPYSDIQQTELISYFWSGKHHRVVKGIQLISLYYTDLSAKSVPVNYRIYNKQEDFTKNDYLTEMISEVLDWGLQPKMVTTDARQASLQNLKFLKHKDFGFLLEVICASTRNPLRVVVGSNSRSVWLLG